MVATDQDVGGVSSDPRAAPGTNPRHLTRRQDDRCDDDRDENRGPPQRFSFMYAHMDSPGVDDCGLYRFTDPMGYRRLKMIRAKAITRVLRG
jgi:hypothetical protein